MFGLKKKSEVILIEEEEIDYDNFECFTEA